jgi:MoaA/NifB/PqqE/SkfB family radical SAM enzyme
MPSMRADAFRDVAGPTVRRIELGFGCNNGCLFCAQGELRSTLPRRDPREVAAAIAEVREGDVVAFVGGEPTLFPELAEHIHAAAIRRPQAVIVQTNGRRLAYRSYARELAAASRLLRLDVSLQGSTAAMHDWHTSTPESFGQTVRGLRHAHAEGIPTGVTVVVTRANYRHLVEIVRVARATGASAIHFAELEPFGSAAARRSLLEPHRAMVAPHLDRARAEALRLGLTVELTVAASRSFAGLGAVETPAAVADRVEVEDSA